MKISIIIPVYNVENYLRQCLDSVINQTYKDLEIICVNDASTDSSLAILQEYAQKDDRIILLNNEKNSKLGPTRNHGMQYATGDYVHFLDSDDWMELNAYETLANYVNKAQNPDIVAFRWNCVDMLSGKIDPIKYFEDVKTEKVVNIHNYPELIKNYNRNAWGKIFRRNFLIDNDISFNDYPCMEDAEHHVHVMIKAKSIYIVQDILLNYRVNRPKSLMDGYYKYYDCALKSYNTCLEYCKDLDNDLQIEILNKELQALLHLIYISFNNDCISFKDMRLIVKNLNISIFGDDLSVYKWYILYNELLSNPKWMLHLKFQIKSFMKKHCFKLFHTIVKLRHKHKLLQRI